ncbi:hypothetical protein ACFOMD_08860 [Sphingoaurantiacus capsulatus]|uniref:Uncharacterized protein n=1 Tax=Sphingoaurantiacus capsulatus TaxID=1771310 RepID=A0ABV7XBQ9_9SPHN
MERHRTGIRRMVELLAILVLALAVAVPIADRLHPSEPPLAAPAD